MRQPLLLIIDTSASMQEENRMHRLYQILESISLHTLDDRNTDELLEIAVLSYGDGVNLVYDFMPPTAARWPDFIATGRSRLGEALVQGFDHMDATIRYYQKNFLPYTNPRIVLVSGSTPDDLTSGDIHWEEVLNTIAQNIVAHNNLKFLIVGLNSAIAPILSSLSASISQRVPSPSSVELTMLSTEGDTRGFDLLERISIPYEAQVVHRSSLTEGDEGKVVSPPYVIGRAIPGVGHRERGIPCQDSYHYAIVPPNCVIIAVADGLGSARMGAQGAEISVRAAVQAMRSRIYHAPDHPDLGTIVREGVEAARSNLMEEATKRGIPFKDFATTLISVIIFKNMVAVAHIGDGAVVAKTSDELTLISRPGESEFANEVAPLTSDAWERSMGISVNLGDFQCVAIFTDGCQRAALRKGPQTLEPFDGFFYPLFSYAQGIRDINSGERDLVDMLMSQKMRDTSDDDMTLVIVVLKRDTPHL